MKDANRHSVRLHPTLAQMAEVYRLPREGGRESPRFAAYRRVVEHTWGLSTYNPMAGDVALECIEALLAIDAEQRAYDCAMRVAAVTGYAGTIDLAVVVASQGLWTDRVATEVQYRTVAARRPGFGQVYVWTREPVSVDGLEREACAEAYRVICTAEHGPADTLHGVLRREGAAYALAARCMSTPQAVDAVSAEDATAVLGALEVLGDSRDAGEIATVLFGDDCARTMGWATLGVPDRAGYRWAIARAASGHPDVHDVHGLRRVEE